MAHADDAQGFSGQLIFARRDVRDHLAPDFLPLAITSQMKMAEKRQDQGKGVIGDGVAVDAAGAGQADIAAAQLVERELVVAGADRLDE